MKKAFLFIFVFLVNSTAMPQAFGWNELGKINTSDKISSLCSDGAGDISAAVVAFGSTYHVSHWDGVRWEKLGNRDFAGFWTGTVRSNLCVENIGYVYAPYFIEADTSWHIARFLAVSWENLPPVRIPGQIFTATLVSMCLDDAGNLFASGDIRNNNQEECLMEWNGLGWTEHSMPWLYYVGMINAICSDGLNVYGAEFNGGAEMALLKWNGIGWSSTDTLSKKFFYQICAGPLGKIYAIGDFTNGAGRPFVAEWDGFNWSEVGGSNGLHANGAIHVICTDAFGGIYAAGAFTNPQGYRYVAKYDGMGWSELGDTLNPLNANGDIFALCADPTGNVYAGGTFTDSAGYSYVAKCAKIDQVKWIHAITPVNTRLNSLDFPNPGREKSKSAGTVMTGFAAGNGGVLLKTTDGGSTWTSLYTGTTVPLNAVSFPGPATGYAAGASGVMIKTTDGGMNWNALNPGNNAMLNSLSFRDSLTGYAAGSGGTILKTTNGGATWTALFTESTDSLFSVLFINADTGFAAGTNGCIIRTTNGGASWTRQSSGTLKTLHSLAFLNDSTGLAAGDSGTILKTTNAGLTWDALNTVITKFCRSVYLKDADTGYIAGNDGCILKTTNGGITWAVQNSGTSSALSSIFLAGTAWVVAGDSGTILRTTLKSPMGINNRQAPNPHLLELYPNPAHKQVTIKSKYQPQNGILSLLDMKGDEVMKQSIGFLPVTLDLSGIKPGVYIFKFISESTVRVARVILEP